MTARRTNVPKWKNNKEVNTVITSRRGRNKTGRKPKNSRAKR